MPLSHPELGAPSLAMYGFGQAQRVVQLQLAIVDVEQHGRQLAKVSNKVRSRAQAGLDRCGTGGCAREGEQMLSPLRLGSNWPR
jgi:hypothetical protein